MLVRALLFVSPFALALTASAQEAAPQAPISVEGTEEPSDPSADPSLDAPEAAEPASPTDAPVREDVAPEPDAADAVPAESRVDTEAAEPTVPTAASACPKGVPCLESGDLALWPSFRLRAAYSFVQPDDKVLFVGHNDGFFLDQARLGVETRYQGSHSGTFRARLTFELASVLSGQGANDPVRPLIAAARDAYVEWEPSDYFALRVGQSYMPFVLEGQLSRTELNFTARSVASDGVRAGQGYFERGLSPDRELGVVMGASEAPLGPVSLDYRVALSNGNGANHLGNDNKLPAAYARFGAAFDELVRGGFSLQYNPRTVGRLPNLYDETDLALAGDVWLRMFGIDVFGQAIFRTTSFDTVFPDGDPSRSDHALGVTTWIVLDDPFGLPTFGFKPGYRFSYYDPRSSSPEDQLFEHTLGLRYDPPTPIPMAFLLDVTFLFESAELNGQLAEGHRSLDNHRAVALVQFDL